MTTTKRKRIVGFDIARGIAILLAMLSHTFTALNYSPAMEVNLLVRSSTPTFIVVFGFFLYLLYYPRIVNNDFYYVRNKLWGRSLQCYLLYFFTCSIWAFVNDFSFIYFIRLTLLLSSTPFTDILRFYAILFFIAPYLLMLLNSRYRLFLVPIIIIPHILVYFIPIPTLDFIPYGAYISTLLYGGGNVIAGPSILHSLFFVFLGVYIAKTFHGNSLFNNKYILLLMILSLIVILIVPAPLKDFSSMKFRNSNALEYFVYSAFMSLIVIELSLFIAKNLKGLFFEPILVFSRSSLVLFCYGNSVLYALYKQYDISNVRIILIFSIFYLICKCEFLLPKFDVNKLLLKSRSNA
ncbi:hypothetical protein V6237_07360 [Pseudoalteromonas carrageenovora]|uniref:hypothetical protein n=1 Tax=Pseudoalteromonas TaxID=53246 RepID=UPI00311FEFDA